MKPSQTTSALTRRRMLVIKDLVDASFVQKAISKHPQWHKLPGLSLDHPFEREETFIV
ncbi:MAG: hypothetical protein HQL93_04060 [Magnetococcales bacterium]|nr:hypothetical protein [Magnetococcales bacterium]